MRKQLITAGNVRWYGLAAIRLCCKLTTAGIYEEVYSVIHITYILRHQLLTD